MKLFKFVGDTRVTVLVIKELRRELLEVSKEWFCSLSTTFVQSKSNEERIETIPYLLKQCHTQLFRFLEHMAVERSNGEDKARTLEVEATLQNKRGDSKESFTSG